MKWFIFIGICFLLMSCEALKSCQQKESEESEMDSNNEIAWIDQNKNYLTENAQKEGIIQTDSGLQYKVLKEGTGKTPQTQQSVEVHYQGTLIHGDEFDSSYKNNQTITFRLDQVIPGWTEGLQLMKEGAIYEFYIPSHLAYGSHDRGPIPAHSTLIFKVELFRVLN